MAVLKPQRRRRAGGSRVPLHALIALAFVTLASVFAAPRSACAQSAASEAAVKAAFVYNFAKFTQWPGAAFGGAQAPLVLCVPAMLESALAQAFGAVDGKSAQGRTIRVRRVARGDELASCHIVYVSDSDARRGVEALRSLGGRPVLTVSDAEGFAETGGMIGLVYVEDRIQFEINVEATEHAGLKLSSQLLRLARIVKDKRK